MQDLIDITQDDIDQTRKEGTEGNCTKCAIGKALVRAGYEDFDLDFNRLRLGMKVYYWPDPISAWQENFVYYKEAEPFSFKISELQFAHETSPL